jgi:hypothetical protein
MTKEQLTLVFMTVLEIDHIHYKRYLWLWWQNPISATSLRLTQTGYEVLRDQLHVAYYAMRVDSSLGKNLKIYLLLDRLITSPFYIQHRSRVIFFGESDKIMLELIDGDLDRYLKILGT